MLDFESRLYRVRTKFPDNINVFDAPWYVQRFVEFVQHEVTEMVTLVLLWLIGSRNPHITSCKLPQTN